MTLVQPKQILKDAAGNEYEILRYLGEGLTAEVYSASRGDEQLALKILKPDLPADIVASFRDEASILRDLAHFERQEEDGLSLIPRVEGRAFEPQLPFKFLGLELVQGDPLADLIERQGGMADADKEGRGERQALIIADQVLRVLDILHTHMRRSYTDFQLKNIWWQEEAQQVKVMDWNHVSLPVKEGERPSGVPHDLLRFGAYLYQILTGKGVGEGSLADGRTEFLLAQRAGQHWQNISVGTRDIILKALHPNPNQRWQTAGDARQAVQEHQKRWQEPVGDISTSAVRAIRAVRRSEPQDALEHVQKAELYIDLYLCRGEDEELVERLQNELDELTGNVSANWGSGLQYYKAGIHSKSTPIWKAEAEALGRLGLWRWVMLSQLGEELSSDMFDAAAPDIEVALNLMERKDWKTASERLQKAEGHGVDGDSFLTLTNELQAHQAYRNAQIEVEMGEWTVAAAAYRETIKHLSKIPSQYRTLLQETYGWQELEAKVHTCVDKAADSNVNRDLITQLQGEFERSYDGGMELLLRTLKTESNNSALPSFVENIVSTLSSKQAIDLLLIALVNGDMGSSEADLRQLLEEKRAKQAQVLAEEQTKQKQMAEEAQLIDLRQTFAADFDQGLQKLRHTLSEDPDNSVLPLFVEEIASTLSREQAILLLLLALEKMSLGSRESSLRQLLAGKQAEQKQAEEKTQLAVLRQTFTADFDQGLKKLRQILNKEPDNPTIIEYVEKTAVNLTLNEAIPLLQTTVSVGNTGSREAALRQLLAQKEADALQQQAQAAFANRDGIRLKELMVQLGSATPPAIVKQLQLDFDEAIKNLSIYQVKNLANLLNLADEEGAERRSQQIESLPSQIDDNTRAWLNNLPVRVDALLQKGEYEAARTEIGKTKEFYVSDAEVVAQADKLLPGIVAVERINSYLDAADKQMRHRTGDFEKARQSCYEVEKMLQSWDGKWMDTTSYEARLADVQQQINKEEENALKKELASAPLSSVLEHFSEVGMTEAKERIEMELKKLRIRNAVLSVGLAVCLLLIALGFYMPRSNEYDTRLVALEEAIEAQTPVVIAGVLPDTTPGAVLTNTVTLSPTPSPTLTPTPSPTTTPSPTQTPTPTAIPELPLSMYTIPADPDSDSLLIANGDSFPYFPSMRLELPPADTFIIADGAEPLRFNHDGQEWDVNLLISGIISGTEEPFDVEEITVMSNQVVPLSEGEERLPNIVDVTWLNSLEQFPHLVTSGTYTTSWIVRSGDSFMRWPETSILTISVVPTPLTMKKINDVTGADQNPKCRYRPVTNSSLDNYIERSDGEIPLFGLGRSADNGFFLVFGQDIKPSICWLRYYVAKEDIQDFQDLPVIPPSVMEFVPEQPEN